MNKDLKKLPKIPYCGSMKVDVQAGQTYYWCSCGLSANQPFCDSSHNGTDFTPVVYKASENKLVGFCGCKHSKSGAICDGSHKSLSSL